MGSSARQRTLVSAAVAVCFAVALAGCRARSEEIRFRNGDVSLAGTLVLPGGRGPHPVMIFVHGDGPDTRAGYRHFAKRFAARGIGALIYDKRGAGQSSGQWQAPFRALADDVLAAMEFLRGRDDVDGEQVGLWGGSQGGWIAALAAADPRARARCVIVKAGSAVSPAELAKSKSIRRVVQAGHSADVVARVDRLMESQFTILRTGTGWTELEERVREADGSWLPLVAVMRYSTWRSSWMTYGTDIDFDIGNTLARVEAPILWILGAADPEIPPEPTVARLEGLRRSGKDITIKVFAGADHQIELPRRHENRPNYAPGFISTMETWAADRCFPEDGEP